MKLKKILIGLGLMMSANCFAVFPGGGVRELVIQPNRRTKNEHKRVNDLLENTRVYTIGGGIPDSDSVRQMITTFYEDQYRHAHDPLAPYFMFMSKDARIAMGVGGVVRMRGWFDWTNAIGANGFAPYLIEIPKNPAHNRRVGGTPSGTDIYFTIFGRNTPLGNWQGFIEANFNGYAGLGLKLKKAYFSVGDWTAGYTTSTFSDPAAEPPTIDGAGPNGVMSRTSLLVRYLKSIKNKWMFGGAIEMPQANYNVDGVNTEKCYDFIPDIIATGQYQWDYGVSHVRLSAMVRSLPYRNLVEGKNCNLAGWGVTASSTVKITNPLGLYGIITYGRGYGSYSGDLSCDQLDLMGVPGKPGELYAPYAISAVFGAKYNILSNLYIGVALSELRNFTKAGTDPSAYKYGLYGAANIFWDIMPRLQVGLEYLAGKRMNVGGEHGNSNRVDAMFQLSF
ncbi:MAG: hypothetical protein HDS94_04165 [Bacteroidales bacterium]|nr:hypothetical protein [Bacteroidales bacterium]